MYLNDWLTEKSEKIPRPELFCNRKLWWYRWIRRLLWYVFGLGKLCVHPKAVATVQTVSNIGQWGGDPERWTLLNPGSRVIANSSGFPRKILLLVMGGAARTEEVQLFQGSIQVERCPRLAAYTAARVATAVAFQTLLHSRLFKWESMVSTYTHSVKLWYVSF